ncbi:hypothetical protein [Enterococcus gilvus]|uniref:hypothetical protein n=1 Tax=Enterococcus gilvus TaxID=160453 RepID=UPI001C8BAFEE|nr:hypothetical protein [Enterococcus gilvus]MBX8936962.1 hypothetical protein [Enterococcus gilvus]
MTKKKALLIVLGLLVIILGFSVYTGYKTWRYEKVNAFYLSRKRDEPIYEQQKALVKNINPELMKDLNIEVTYQEKSKYLFSMTKVEEGASYTFNPNVGYGDVMVTVADAKNYEELCGFRFKKNLDECSVIVSKLSEEQTMIYSEKAKKIYKQILDDIYDNWEIQ